MTRAVRSTAFLCYAQKEQINQRNGDRYMAIDLEQEVETKWVGRTKDYYVSKGYIFTSRNAIFTIKAKDLQTNSSVRINFKCDNCGKEVNVKYGDYNKTKSDLCLKCVRAITQCGKPKILFEDVIKLFISKGYNLISTSSDYKNSASRLLFTCTKHGDQMISYDGLLQGRGCNRCGYEMAANKNRNSFKDVKSAFNNKGYILVSTESDYTTAKDKLIYICSKHGKQSINYGNLQQGKGCPRCGDDKISGENNHGWKGGVTNIRRYLRVHLSSWTQQQLQRTNYTCQITGKQGSLNVHHMYSFNNILQDTMKEINMDIRPNIGDYSEDELQLIVVNFVKNNDLYANPIVMLESVHKEFHSFCGGTYKDTSNTQLSDFISMYYKEAS